MPTPQPMEPMDTYLCILLSLDVITTTRPYTQQEICAYLVQNATQVAAIMSDPQALQSVRTQYMSEAQSIVVLDKSETCDE